MIPYSTRFLAWSASELPTPYEVPAGYVVVVRDLDVTSGGGSIINWALSINGVAKFAVGAFTVESIQQQASWRGRVIVNAGEQLVFESDGSTDGVVNGYLLVANVSS